MKKKILVFTFLCLLSVSFSQQTNLKHYSDYTNDFEGYSVALYFDKDIDYESFINNVETKIFETTEKQPIKKLSKNNMWLLKCALNEWELAENEVYVVCIASSLIAREYILIFTRINENENFDWWAVLLDKEDLLKIENYSSSESTDEVLKEEQYESSDFSPIYSPAQY